MVKFLPSCQWLRVEVVLLSGDNERTAIWIAPRPRTVSAGGLAPTPGAVVTEFQSDGSR